MGIHHAHILGDIDLGLVNNAFWEIQQTTNHQPYQRMQETDMFVERGDSKRETTSKPFDK